MRAVYYSVQHTIAPQITAAIHLGLLPRDRPPLCVEWQKIPYYKGIPRQELGRVLLVGHRGEWEIFLLLLPKNKAELILKVCQSAMELVGEAGNVIFCDCGNLSATLPKEKHPPLSWIDGFYAPLVTLVQTLEEGAKN